MKTPRKRLTLKTPKRSNKTPLKMSKRGDEKRRDDDRSIVLKKESNFTTKRDNTPLDILKELESHENKLLEKYRKENQFLRSLGGSGSVLKDLLGLDVQEVEGEFVVKYKVEERSISFTLIPSEEMFIYKLVGFKNLELPSFLSEEISFEKQQVNKFFYKVMEVMISK